MTTISIDKRILNKYIRVETELENEGMKALVIVVVFEDEWESEVIEGDGVTVHMGK
jgi:hypothetical protein